MYISFLWIMYLGDKSEKQRFFIGGRKVFRWKCKNVLTDEKLSFLVVKSWVLIYSFGFLKEDGSLSNFLSNLVCLFRYIFHSSYTGTKNWWITFNLLQNKCFSYSYNSLFLNQIIISQKSAFYHFKHFF